MNLILPDKGSERDQAAVLRSMELMHRHGYRIETMGPRTKFDMMRVRIRITHRRNEINEIVGGQTYRLAVLAAAQVAEDAELNARTLDLAVAS